MAKRTVEFEDSTGPFTVKVKGDTEGQVHLVIYCKSLRDKDLHIHLDGAGQVEDLGLMLQHMAEDLSKEMDR